MPFARDPVPCIADSFVTQKFAAGLAKTVQTVDLHGGMEASEAGEWRRYLPTALGLRPLVKNDQFIFYLLNQFRFVF